MLNHTELLVAFCAFAFVSSITPGPNNLMLMASGANFGLARSVPHVLGVGIGFTLMIVLVGLGVAQLFVAFPVAYDVLKVLSIAYLVYLAYKIATAKPPAQDVAAAGKPMTFVQAMAFQWVNPKAWTMALTATTAYATPSNPLVGLLAVALIFGGINLPSISAWTLMGVQLRRFLADPTRLRIFNVTTALILLATLYPLVFAGH